MNLYFLLCYNHLIKTSQRVKLHNTQYTLGSIGAIVEINYLAERHPPNSKQSNLEIMDSVRKGLSAHGLALPTNQSHIC